MTIVLRLADFVLSVPWHLGIGRDRRLGVPIEINPINVGGNSSSRLVYVQEYLDFDVEELLEELREREAELNFLPSTDLVPPTKDDILAPLPRSRFTKVNILKAGKKETIDQDKDPNQSTPSHPAMSFDPITSNEGSSNQGVSGEKLETKLGITISELAEAIFRVVSRERNLNVSRANFADFVHSLKVLFYFILFLNF